MHPSVYTGMWWQLIVRLDKLTCKYICLYKKVTN